MRDEQGLDSVEVGSTGTNLIDSAPNSVKPGPNLAGSGKTVGMHSVDGGSKWWPGKCWPASAESAQNVADAEPKLAGLPQNVPLRPC